MVLDEIAQIWNINLRLLFDNMKNAYHFTAMELSFSSKTNSAFAANSLGLCVVFLLFRHTSSPVGLCLAVAAL